MRSVIATQMNMMAGTIGLGPIGSKITSFWDMSESSGTRADSRLLNPATENGGTISSGTGPKGGTDVALYSPALAQYLLPGSNASTRIDVSTASTGGNHCLFGWVKQISAAGVQDFIGIWDATSSSALVYMVRLYSGSLFMFNGGASYYSASVAAPSVGTWFFFCCWRQASDGKLRVAVNGGTPTVGAGPTNPSSTSIMPLTFCSVQSNDRFNGYMSRIGWIKGDYLTTAQQTTLYNGGPSGAMSWADIVAAGI